MARPKIVVVPIAETDWPTVNQSLEDFVIALSTALQEATSALPMPLFRDDKTPRTWDFPQKTLGIALVCMVAQAISSFGAAITLWRTGHLSEVWALTRSVSECTENVAFLLLPSDEPGLADRQKALLDTYFCEQGPEEDYKGPGTQSRRKVTAALGRMLHADTGILNPHDVAQILVGRTAAQSNYVHANYRTAMLLGVGESGESFLFSVRNQVSNLRGTSTRPSIPAIGCTGGCGSLERYSRGCGLYKWR